MLTRHAPHVWEPVREARADLGEELVALGDLRCVRAFAVAVQCELELVQLGFLALEVEGGHESGACLGIAGGGEEGGGVGGGEGVE
jgi:hypothetical protein